MSLSEIVKWWGVASHVTFTPLDLASLIISTELCVETWHTCKWALVYSAIAISFMIPNSSEILGIPFNPYFLEKLPSFATPSKESEQSSQWEIIGKEF